MNEQIPAPRRRRRRWPWVLLSLVVVGGSVGGILFYNHNSQARAKRAISTEEFDLRLGKSDVADIQVSVNEVGTIEPLVDSRVAVPCSESRFWRTAAESVMLEIAIGKPFWCYATEQPSWPYTRPYEANDQRKLNLIRQMSLPRPASQLVLYEV